MESTKRIALDRAVRLLDALKLSYVIMLDDGEKIVVGDIEVTEKKPRKRRQSNNPHGTFTGLLNANNFDAMAVGDVITIDAGEFSVESLRSTASSKANRIWNGGKVVTSVKGSSLEIMRVE